MGHCDTCGRRRAGRNRWDRASRARTGDQNLCAPTNDRFSLGGELAKGFHLANGIGRERGVGGEGSGLAPLPLTRKLREDAGYSAAHAAGPIAPITPVVVHGARYLLRAIFGK